MLRSAGLGVLLSAILVQSGMAAEITFENPRFRAVLGGDAAWKSLIDKATGSEYCWAKKPIRLATVRVDGRTFTANTASIHGDRLTIGFHGCDTQLTYSLSTTDDWIAFQIVRITGSRPTHVTLLQIGVSIHKRGGSRLNAVWNDSYAICLRATNLQSRGVFSRRSDYTLLSATSQDSPGPKLEGAGAAIVATPTSQLKPILHHLSTAFDLTRNAQRDAASKDLATARQSYWFLNFGESDVDTVIEYCRKTGFRQVMMNSGSWCTSIGHYSFNTRNYSDGIDSLRRCVAKLHDHGILVGMHTFASKVSKHDPYVTPIPNRGFWVDKSATLAADIGDEKTVVQTLNDLSQWPGSPVCKQQVWEGHVSKHQEVIIDDEIIRYEAIGPDGKWDTFLGCERGAWGSHAVEHSSGTECRHYAVDGCINGYIIDQESQLFQETTSRLAHVFNTCDFDMVYFDGSEDVDRRRYHYYSSNAHAVPLRKFTKRPLIHMGGGLTHGLWHSFTRSGTIDQYPGTYMAYIRAGGTIDEWPTCKDHIDRTVRRVIGCEDEMIPGELGWFGIGPKSGDYDGLQFDEIEYLMCKSLAYNAPISLQSSFPRMEAHPLTPDILEIIRRYELARLKGQTPVLTRETLKQEGEDFVMLPETLWEEQGTPEFIEVEEVADVGGTHDIRAFFGSHKNDTLVTVWHYAGKEGKLVVNPTRVEAFDVRGMTVPIANADGSKTVPISHRRVLLRFPDSEPESVRKLLVNASLELRKPIMIRIQAEDYRTVVGTMAKGSEVDIADAGAQGDLVLCRGPIDRSGQDPNYCEYHVDIPRKGRWTLWAHVRYPKGGDMSFGIVRPDEPVTLTGRQVLGNCGMNEKRWHWTGRGGGSTAVPPGSPIRFDLEPGKFAFRIYPREGSGTAATNPRIDRFLLTNDPDYVPPDTPMEE